MLNRDLAAVSAVLLLLAAAVVGLGVRVAGEQDRTRATVNAAVADAVRPLRADQVATRTALTGLCGYLRDAADVPAHLPSTAPGWVVAQATRARAAWAALDCPGDAPPLYQ